MVNIAKLLIHIVCAYLVYRFLLFQLESVEHNKELNKNIRKDFYEDKTNKTEK